MKLSREQFVKLCTEAIFVTKTRITIRNQKSGYIKFHKEIKNNHYFKEKVRGTLSRYKQNDFMQRHALIDHTGLGNCNELATYLAVEIGERINNNDALARILVVSSKMKDHVYLEIKIKLLNETGYSYWEVDAWDPRIIDISTRPDGTVKNKQALETYGYAINIKATMNTNEINYNNKYSFAQIPKPIEGRPEREATPDDNIAHRERKIYRDYTLEKAYEEKKLDPCGNIHYLQRVSFWQKKPEEKNCKFEDVIHHFKG